jgi:hypothetical protein
MSKRDACCLHCTLRETCGNTCPLASDLTDGEFPEFSETLKKEVSSSTCAYSPREFCELCEAIKKEFFQLCPFCHASKKGS